MEIFIYKNYLLCCKCSGYVSEMRRKNWKMCWPFASESELNNFEEQASMLPHLNVPKFKWWHCQNCLQEIGSRGIEKDRLDLNSCSVGFKSNTTNSQMPSFDNTAILLSDYQQAQRSNIVEERIVDATNVNSNMHHPSSRSDKKEEKVEVAATTSKGKYTSSQSRFYWILYLLHIIVI